MDSDSGDTQNTNMQSVDNTFCSYRQWRKYKHLIHYLFMVSISQHKHPLCGCRNMETDQYWFLNRFSSGFKFPSCALPCCLLPFCVSFSQIYYHFEWIILDRPFILLSSSTLSPHILVYPWDGKWFLRDIKDGNKRHNSNEGCIKAVY